MQDGIHPEYYKVKVNCVCGASFELNSTKKEFGTDICSQCHPFFTGKHKLMDTEGRIDRFRKKYAGNTAAVKK
ncbi:MAG: 50S ribosomal protein L31 [Oligoflexia bacterium]|nr:50S ribosomal protein L31 [Oligoflexia bacterium]